MSQVKNITVPFTDDIVADLKSGDQVFMTGVLYTARDAAHKRLVALLDEGKELPFDINGAVIYYVGPSPTKPGAVVGSAGPTTSYRMDAYSERLMEVGMKGMIGKGKRAKGVVDAGVKHGCIYLAATGGAAALIARTIKKVDIIAYEDLGPEAIRRMEVEDFPAVVINDLTGADLYEIGQKQYQRT